MFTILLCIFVLLVLIILATIYFKLIHPEKRIYDVLHAQGINGEPFVPLIGQISEFRRYREADMIMAYYEDLAKSMVMFTYLALVLLYV
jgi:hypothetical protein